MWIVSERDVFTTLITRYGESLCYGRLPYTYDEALFIFSITSSRYRVGTAKTQGRFSSHCCTCIIMRIPPITIMKLHRAVRKFQLHKSLMRETPDPFPIFEGWVRQRQTRPSTVTLAAHHFVSATQLNSNQPLCRLLHASYPRTAREIEIRRGEQHSSKEHFNSCRICGT